MTEEYEKEVFRIKEGMTFDRAKRIHKREVNRVGRGLSYRDHYADDPLPEVTAAVRYLEEAHAWG